MGLAERLKSERARWGAGLFLVLSINLFGLHFLLTPEDMTVGQENHDTRIMYKHLRYWNEPTKWLYGDWPLQNGFYRPLPALAFEVDVRLWDKDFPKYKIFNWLVCATSSFLLIAFVLSLTEDRSLALLSGILFSFWQTDLLSILPIYWMGAVGAAGILVWTLFAKKGSQLCWLTLACIAFYLGYEWENIATLGDLSGQSFGYRTMGWPPGRTATLFGLFSLLCLWGYCLWERSHRMRWLVLSTIGFIGAFMSYEQAVMLPAVLFACGVYLKMHGLRVRWPVHIFFWGLMAAYAWWHFAYLPIETRYATQHSSSLGSGIRSLMLWLFPGYGSVVELSDLFDPNIGLFALLMISFWIALFFLVANAMTWIGARREWQVLLFGLLCSAIVFAPMAFQLRLTHYFYLPLAFRSIFVSGLTLAAWKLAGDVSMRRSRAEPSLG